MNLPNHQIGDRRCEECYRGYPMKCLCGGFIHAQFVRETWDNQIQLKFSCDVCGDAYKFPAYTTPRIKFKRKKFDKRR